MHEAGAVGDPVAGEVDPPDGAGEGGQVLGVMTVVDRQEGGREAIERAGYLVEAFLTAADLGLTLAR